MLQRMQNHAHVLDGIPAWPLTWLHWAEMFSTAQKTQELWMWKMEYLHHEQRPLYFGEWF